MEALMPASKLRLPLGCSTPSQRRWTSPRSLCNSLPVSQALIISPTLKGEKKTCCGWSDHEGDTCNYVRLWPNECLLRGVWSAMSVFTALPVGIFLALRGLWQRQSGVPGCPGHHVPSRTRHTQGHGVWPVLPEGGSRAGQRVRTRAPGGTLLPQEDLLQGCGPCQEVALVLFAPHC